MALMARCGAAGGAGGVVAAHLVHCLSLSLSVGCCLSGVCATCVHPHSLLAVSAVGVVGCVE